jgi:hypothetical protein
MFFQYPQKHQNDIGPLPVIFYHFLADLKKEVKKLAEFSAIFWRAKFLTSYDAFGPKSEKVVYKKVQKVVILGPISLDKGFLKHPFWGDFGCFLVFFRVLSPTTCNCILMVVHPYGGSTNTNMQYCCAQQRVVL